jgi:methylphosphotriester-DNA--protein-cysteine methyltransferase
VNAYRLTAADGSQYESSVPGSLGGYRPGKIYGRLDCPSANRYLANGHYHQHRVFFAGEPEAIAAGYRPCGKCLPEQYAAWKAGGTVRTAGYPWHTAPAPISAKA